MSDVGVLINTAVAILAIVILIVRFRVNPVISLVVGSLYLGLASKLGLDKTIETITGGFGDIMAEVGLLIAFGVLMGSILQELGAIERLVKHLLRLFGPKRLPYSMALTIGTLLQSIYLDVLLVISAPLARTASKRIGHLGTARMATALAIGLETGIVLMVPGVGALALAALLHVPLGKMLLFGLVLIIPTILISVTIMTFLFRRGLWKSEVDEQQTVVVEEELVAVATDGTSTAGDSTASSSSSASGTGGVATQYEPETEAGQPPLGLLFVPLLASLLLIGFGAIAEVAKWDNKIVQFVSDPVVALLVGLIGTCLIGRYAMGQPRVEKAIARGFKESGQILILTAVGGSLAAVVAAGGLGDILRGYFSAHTFAPLLLVWAIAAVLHIAVGSVTISAITAAGILAPIAPALGLDPVLIALAAGAGSLFAVHVTSNTFWLLQSLMGQTTRGTLKSCTVGVSVASVVAIILLMPLSLVF